MEKENRPGKLRETMATTLRVSVEQIVRLAGVVHQELITNNPPSLPESAAVLRMIGVYSQAGATILEERGGIIFDGSKEVPPEKEISGPRTFGELLRVKIDETLPVGKEQFGKKDLSGFLKVSLNRVKPVIDSLGLSGQKFFLREQVIEVVERTLTSSGKVGVGQNDYNRSKLVGAFRVSHEQLDEWSNIVGHNWKQKRTVDKETALAIRGLVVLDKLTKKP